MSNYCIDCRHHVFKNGDAVHHYCEHPNLVSPVTGTKKLEFCGYVRERANLCAQEGRWYEAKSLAEPGLPENGKTTNRN